MTEREALADLTEGIGKAAANAMAKALLMNQAASVLAAAMAFHDWALTQTKGQFSSNDVVGFLLDYGKSVVNLDD